MVLVAPVFAYNFYMSTERKTISPLQTGSLVHLLNKKTRNDSEESTSSCDVAFNPLDTAQNVTAIFDPIMERLKNLSFIEGRFDSMASTMVNIESTLSRLDADVALLKEGARKRDKINKLERLINYTEVVAELQKGCMFTKPSFTSSIQKKGGNVMAPTMHRFQLYYQSGVVMWPLHFKMDVFQEGEWQAPMLWKEKLLYLYCFDTEHGFKLTVPSLLF